MDYLKNPLLAIRWDKLLKNALMSCCVLRPFAPVRVEKYLDSSTGQNCLFLAAF